MIPLRVYVKNFLCHADQEFVFEGHTLWLLHGPNGVGKSAVFDAIVYALFGEHERRETSKTDIVDLLRHGESSMRVEFDFEYQQQRYRVWRTRTRSGQPKQGVNRFVDGSPTPLSNINGVKDLDKWVTGTLGLSYEAFVSAVLLRQGAAERLIDSDKDARRDLFRGIIDLDPYIKLHAATAIARTQAYGSVRSFRELFKDTVEVSTEAIDSATVLHQQKQQVAQDREAEERAVRESLSHARHWEKLELRHQALTQTLAEAQVRMTRSDALQRDVERLKELRDAIPARRRWTHALEIAKTTRGKHATLTERHTALEAKRKTNAQAVDASRHSSVQERERVTSLDGQLVQLANQRDTLQGQIEQAEKAADLHQQLQKATAGLKQFDTALDSQHTAAERAASDAQAAKDAYPHLSQLQQHRAEFHKAAKLIADTATIEITATAKLKEAESAETNAKATVTVTAEKLGTSQQALAVAQSQWKDVKTRQDRFLAQAKGRTCSECGQPIDETHAERERAKFIKQLAETEAEGKRLKAETESLTKQSTEAQRALVAASTQRQTLEDELKTLRNQHQQAEQQAKASRRDFDAALKHLAEPLAKRVPAIESTGYPSDNDVTAAKTLSSELAAHQRSLKSLADQLQQRAALTASLSTLRKAVEAVGAPADVSDTKAKHATMVEQIRKTTAERAATEQSRLRHEQDEKQKQKEQDAIDKEIAALVGEVNAVTTALALAEHEVTSAEAALPVSVRGDVDLQTLVAEQQRLDAAGVQKQFDALEEDRTLQAERERQLAGIAGEIAQLPAVGRRPVADVERDIATAHAATSAARTNAETANKAREDLIRRREVRADLEGKMVAAEHTHSLHDRLADLLGAEGLQRDLLRDAERRILVSANEMLVKVSGGDLRFEPPSPDGDKAFDLSIRRLGCPDPIVVGNLSGGQRCRVAVSLALAVCRFASNEAHPLESIIIDEAFANLDREGRMAMIDVLRDGTLAGGLLKRIIVVSHHEDVLAAFPVGYRLSSKDGVTSVERF